MLFPLVQGDKVFIKYSLLPFLVIILIEDFFYDLAVVFFIF